MVPLNGNLSDDLGTVLKDPFEAEKTLGLKIKPTKCDFFYLGTSLKNANRQF